MSLPQSPTLRARLAERRGQELFRGKLREIEQWSVINEMHIRHDLLYRDPASGHWRQIYVDQVVDFTLEPAALHHVRRNARGIISAALNSQCGVGEAAAHQVHLPLPIGARGRYI